MKKYLLVFVLMLAIVRLGVADSEIEIISPNGGETWVAGSDTVFTWDTKGEKPVNLEFSSNGGANWSPVANNVNEKEFAWRVPAVESDSCLFRVGTNPLEIFNPYLENVNFGRVYDIELSPTQDLAASASGIGIVIWNPITTDTLRIIKTMDDIIQVITWSPDGKYIASGTAHANLFKLNEIQVWEVATGKLIKTLYKSNYRETIREIEWSPDGKYIAAAHKNTAVIINFESSKLVNSFKVDADYVHRIFWHPESKEISFVADAYGGSYTEPDLLTTWDPFTGEKLRSYDINIAWDAAYSPDGKKIVATAYVVNIYDTETGESEEPIYKYISNHSNVVWSPDGRYIASVGNIGGDMYLNIYDYVNKTTLAGNIDCKGIYSWDSGSTKPCWSSDSKKLLFISSQGIKYFSIDSLSDISSHYRNTITRHKVYWNSDGTVYSPEGSTYFDAEDNHLIEKYEGYLGAPSPDDSKIIHLNNRGKLIFFDKIAKEKYIHPNEHGSGNVFYGISCLAWSPDGSKYYTGSAYKQIMICDASTHEIVDRIYGNWGQMRKIIISPDGEYLAAIDDYSATMWHIETKEKVYVGQANAIAWHPTEPIFIVSGKNRRAEMINVETGEAISHSIPENTDASALDWSRDGKYIALASYDWNLTIWDSTFTRILYSEELTNKKVYDVKFCPDSRRLLTGNTVGVVNMVYLYDKQYFTDISESTFSIKMPRLESYDIDLGECEMTQTKDSLLTDFLKNTGLYKCRVDSVWISGDDETAFNFENDFKEVTLNPQETQSNRITFTPNKSGDNTANLNIITQADTLVYSIIGRGVAFVSNSKSADIVSQTDGEITIEFSIPEESKVDAKVYDIMGRKVESLLENQIKKRGVYSETLDISEYCSGAYFVAIEIDGEIEVIKFIVTR
jgi:WD40 repeat protein